MNLSITECECDENFLRTRTMVVEDHAFEKLKFEIEDKLMSAQTKQLEIIKKEQITKFDMHFIDLYKYTNDIESTDRDINYTEKELISTIKKVISIMKEKYSIRKEHFYIRRRKLAEKARKKLFI